MSRYQLAVRERKMEMSNDTPLGTVTNTLSNGGAGGGIGSKCLSGPAVFVDERPTFWISPHEADRKGYARSTNGQQGRGRNETQGR